MTHCRDSAVTSTAPTQAARKRDEDKLAIAEGLSNFFGPADVAEVRALGKGGTLVGYVRGSDIASYATQIVNAAKHREVYFVPNPVDPVLIARATGDLAKRNESAKDADIIERRWLLIDIDPVKASGFGNASAADAEKGCTLEVAESVKAYMREHHWPEPLVNDSGNGVHMYYRLPTPITRGESADLGTKAVSDLLKVMAKKFDTPGAKIDPSVYNPSRIMKIPGTMACKGDNTLERPHRLCRVLEVPDDWKSPAPTGAAHSLESLAESLDPGGSIRAKLALRPVLGVTVAPSSNRACPPGFTFANQHKRAEAYLKTMPIGVEGQKGSNPTYAAACAMVHGFCLDEFTAMGLLMRFYNPKCDPPWSEKDMRHKVDDAATDPHAEEYGYLLKRGDKKWKAASVRGARSTVPPSPAPLRGEQSAPPSVGESVPPAGVDALPAQDARRCISAGVEVVEYVVNNQVIEALGNDNQLYQRADQLVTIRVDPEGQGDAPSSNPAPRIVVLELPTLRERISRYVSFTRAVTREGGEVVEQPMAITEACLRAVHARGTWPGVRPLTGLIDSPIVTGAGRVIDRCGYDPGTQLFSTYGGPAYPADAPPTQADARAAANELLELVSEFPFEKEHHQSAWLAALLTPLVRCAFAHEPTPLMLFDATGPGSGKGLLCSLVSWIVAGRMFSPRTYIHEEAEFAKCVLSIALDGTRMTLLDNVEGPFGNPTLKLALTSAHYTGRVLGQTKDRSVPLTTCWYATANNVRLTSDMDRRVCVVRLCSNVERPEERTFKIKKLEEHVIANRQRLLGCALTLLTAYIRAGFPDESLLRPYGSYIGWTKFVRGAIVWAGLPDPIPANAASSQVAEPTLDAMKVLMGNWEAISPRGEALTAKEIFEAVSGPSSRARLGDAYTDVSQAMSELKEQSPKCLGDALRAVKGRVFDGRKFVDAGKFRRAVRWAVVNSDGSPLDYGATSPTATPTQTDLDGCTLDGRDRDPTAEIAGPPSDEAAPSFTGGI